MNLKQVAYPVILLLLIILLVMFSPETQKALFTYKEIDSVGHLVSFFFLAWLIHGILHVNLEATIIGLIAYGGLTEIGQGFLGFRNSELSDFIADGLGVLLYATFALLFAYIKQATQKK